MERLTKVLNSVSTETIKAEIYGKIIKNSISLNKALKKEYPAFSKDKASSKALLLKIWNFTIAQTTQAKISATWLKLFKSLDRILKTLFQNENTLEIVCTEFRKNIKLKFGNSSEIYKQSIYNLGVSQERSQQRKQEYVAKVKERNNERGKLQLINADDIIAIIEKLKNSTDPYEKSLAVLLATGSRSVELFKISEYSIVEGNENRIIVRKIAKDRKQTDVIIKRPLVGLTNLEVVKLVDEIRNELKLDNLTNQKITSRTNTPLNKAFAEWIQPLITGFKISSHKTRYIYAQIAYILYGKPAKIPEESYINEILAHASANSTKSYLGINIQFKDRVKPPPIKDIELDQFSNSHRRTMNAEKKIQAVIEALKALKEKNIKLTQRELRAQLNYGGNIMSAAYKLAREQGIL